MTETSAMQDSPIEGGDLRDDPDLIRHAEKVIKRSGSHVDIEKSTSTSLNLPDSGAVDRVV